MPMHVAFTIILTSVFSACQWTTPKGCIIDCVKREQEKGQVESSNTENYCIVLDSSPEVWGKEQGTEDARNRLPLGYLAATSGFTSKPERRGLDVMPCGGRTARPHPVQLHVADVNNEVFLVKTKGSEVNC